jgi:hypothetical protein
MSCPRMVPWLNENTGLMADGNDARQEVHQHSGRRLTETAVRTRWSCGLGVRCSVSVPRLEIIQGMYRRLTFNESPFS